MAPQALSLLKRHRWPGNIRELENALERAIALAKSNVLHTEDFDRELCGENSSSAPASKSPSLEELEKRHILAVLQEVKFNKSRASERLGIDRATLYRKAQKYGIELKGK